MTVAWKVADFKVQFFDRPKVERAVNRAGKRNLSKWGGYTRRTARSSLKPPPAKLKKLYLKGLSGQPVSDPGKPPYSHTGLIKDFLFYAWDGDSESVVVGPAALNGKKYQDALKVLEYGGTAQREYGPKREARRVTYRARPFMGPAAAETNKRLPEIWAGSVR